MNNHTYFEIAPVFGYGEGVRRCDMTADVSAASEILVDGEWKPSSLTAGEIRSMLAFGSASEVEAPQEQSKGPEWVYFCCNHSTGWHYTKRRYKAGADERDCTEALYNGVWQESALTVGLVLAMMADGGAHEDEGTAILCNERGEPLEEQRDRTATDPETGFTYRVTKGGEILSRPPNGSSFCASPCTIRVIKTLARLGLLEI